MRSPIFWEQAASAIGRSINGTALLLICALQRCRTWQRPSMLNWLTPRISPVAIYLRFGLPTALSPPSLYPIHAFSTARQLVSQRWLRKVGPALTCCCTGHPAVARPSRPIASQLRRSIADACRYSFVRRISRETLAMRSTERSRCLIRHPPNLSLPHASDLGGQCHSFSTVTMNVLSKNEAG